LSRPEGVAKASVPVPDVRPLLRTAALSLVLACAAPDGASAAQVWTAVASEKIRPSAPARTQPSAQISAARNEFEAFQIVVTGAATNVRATATALTGPGTITSVRLYREALIHLAYPSALDGATGAWPDALVPDVDEVVGEKRNAFPFAVPAGESRVLWVDVFVPPGTPAGAYSGEVRVTWDGGGATVPVALTVRPFTLPSTASLKSAFRFTYGAIPSEHGLSGAAFSQLRVRYGAVGLDHRVTLSSHDDGEWGSLAHLDTYFGPLLDGTAATQLDGAALTTLEYLGSATNTSWMQQWTSHNRAQGWSDRQFHYTCDEPPGGTCTWSQIGGLAASARSVGLRTLVTTTIQQSNANGVTSSIDLLVPVINYLDDRPNGEFSGDQRAKYDAFLAGSPTREVWAYQSCMSHGCGGTVNFGSPSSSDQYFTGWPSYMIDASAVRNRAMEWLSFRYRLTGELYYETAMAYGHDPWTDQWDFNGNGDGTLFYPGTPAKIGGTTHIPVASLRLKMIREGMEDYEYLKILSDLGDAALAKEVADGLFPNAYSTERSPELLMAARERIAGRIVELMPPGGATTGPGSGPTDSSTPLGEDGASDGGAVAAATASLPQGGCNAGGASGLVALIGLAGALRRRRSR
jgi:uncharacterized protein (TIGR03382 family)